MPNPDENTPSAFTVNMQPVGRRVQARPDMTLLEAAQSAGVELASLCGGGGACDSCKVRLAEGELSPPTLEEQALFSAAELRQGYRLACQAYPLSDVRIDIPPESLTAPQRLQVEGHSTEVALSPAVTAIDIEADEPGLDDLRADTRRIRECLGGAVDELHFHPAVLGELSGRARELGWNLRLALRGELPAASHDATHDATHGATYGAKHDAEVIAVLPTGSPLAGLAVDVGTTKVAAYLVDLGIGATLAKAGAMNPQIGYGEDVVSRIAYCDKHVDGRRTLQRRLVESLNDLVGEMCQQAGLSCEQVVDAVVVGNTAMHHLFAGLPVSQLGHAPYVPAASEALDLRAADLGLKIAPGAYVYLPPNVAGYVGADHVAMLLASGVWEAPQTTLALDIGTNTEISLNHGGRLLCCSCASGPAFEGAHIRDGMRAAPGAIERVQITPPTQPDQVYRLRLQTIGDLLAVGICGSGILDAVAEMLEAGVLDRRGALNGSHPLVRRNDGQLNEFILAPAAQSGHGKDVLVGRRDVNEIQLAKGAIRAGIEILLAEAGISAEEIQDFIVAGAFGTYISIPSAIRVGMFPQMPLGRFRQVGNAAGAGARQMLVSTRQRGLAQGIAQRLEYIELSSHPDFTNEFSHRLFF